MVVTPKFGIDSSAAVCAQRARFRSVDSIELVVQFTRCDWSAVPEQLFTKNVLRQVAESFVPGGRGSCRTKCKLCRRIKTSVAVKMVIALAEDFDSEDLEYATRAVVLHELAHILDHAVLCDERRDEPVEKIQFESLVVASATRQSPRSDPPPYAGHGPSFIHLAHRANVAGLDTSPAAIFAGHRHRLSPASLYQEALDDEPDQQINNRLKDLPSVELPSRFLEVWNSDVQHYELHTSSANGVE